MEEILGVIVQVVVELGIQMFGGMLVDAAAGVGSRNRDEAGCGWLALNLILGAVLGWVSTLIAPKLLLPNAALRVGNLVFAPVAAGGLGYAAGRYVFRDNGPWGHFWRGFVFALAFGLTRLAWGVK